MSDDLSVDVETLAHGNDLVGNLWADIDLHTVPHVEHLVHLFPVGAGTVVDDLEQWRNGEHVIFHDAAVLAYEVQHLCLSTACAVHHSVDLRAHLVEQSFNDWSVGAGGGEHELTGIDIESVNLIREMILTTVYELIGHGMVIALGELLCEVLSKDIGGHSSGHCFPYHRCNGPHR